MDAPLLSLSHVTLRYEHGITALCDVSFDVAEGERICVLGPNGSGKSTLASVLCGLLAPDEGAVTLVGEQVFGADGIDFDAYRRARRQLGLVFQNPDDQLVTSIVEEDVAFGPENLGVPSAEIGPRVARELHRVGLDQYAQADPSRLSGGQKQRVAIAGALAMEPRVLVLDEPGALLDVRGRRGIMRVMDKLHAAGTTVVHVTHFMEEALRADRVVVLDKGRLVLQGTPREVFSHVHELVALGLEEPFAAQLAEELRERGVDIVWTCEDEELLSSLAGVWRKGACESEFAAGADAADARGSVETTGPRAVTTHKQNNGSSSNAASASSFVTTSTSATPEPGAGSTGTHTVTTSTPAISAAGVCYSYGEIDAREARHPALDRVTFQIPQGSNTTIVGQTGSGKSTLLRLLCALEVPDAGSLVVAGLNTADKRQRRQLHGNVGYVMQHPERQLFAETVWDDVAYGPTNLGLTRDEVECRCARALATVGLTGREQSSPFHLSGGQQRLCALAGILAMRPSILVLDEPMAGLDPRGRIQLRDIIQTVNRQGTTVVQVTHSMNDAAASGQVIVLNEGTVLLQGSPSEVFSDITSTTLHENGLGLPDALKWALKLVDVGYAGIGQPLTLGALADALAGTLTANNGTVASVSAGTATGENVSTQIARMTESIAGPDTAKATYEAADGQDAGAAASENPPMQVRRVRNPLDAVIAPDATPTPNQQQGVDDGL